MYAGVCNYPISPLLTRKTSTADLSTKSTSLWGIVLCAFVVYFYYIKNANRPHKENNIMVLYLSNSPLSLHENNGRQYRVIQKQHNPIVPRAYLCNVTPSTLPYKSSRQIHRRRLITRISLTSESQCLQISHPRIDFS